MTDALHTYDHARWQDRDPSLPEVVDLARHLAARLPDPAQHTGRDQAAVHQLIAVVKLLPIVSDTGQHPQAIETAAKAAHNGLEILRQLDYHQPLGDAANDLLPTSAFLYRLAHRAVNGLCRLGGSGDCVGDGRVRVFVYDPFRTESEPGCPGHAADEARRWDHGHTVEVVLIGQPDHTRDVLLRLDGDLNPAPRCYTTPPDEKPRTR
ncbi:hypothetical protein ABZ502_17665 [Streptomyces abikoensis]|uniref:hypothetical protein n=1 Tax=Streptomyces abikoensis TaxID=97398 RepID=UPI0033F0DBD4